MGAFIRAVVDSRLDLYFRKWHSSSTECRYDSQDTRQKPVDSPFEQNLNVATGMMSRVNQVIVSLTFTCSSSCWPAYANFRENTHGEDDHGGSTAFHDR